MEIQFGTAQLDVVSLCPAAGAECGQHARMHDARVASVCQISGLPLLHGTAFSQPGGCLRAHKPRPVEVVTPAISCVQRSSKSKMEVHDFFTEYGEANRYKIKEVIGKGSYGVVCSALDNKTGEKVAIKKINNVFDHVSDATRILREIKLLRLLRHPGELFVWGICVFMRLPPAPSICTHMLQGVMKANSSALVA